MNKSLIKRGPKKSVVWKRKQKKGYGPMNKKFRRVAGTKMEYSERMTWKYQL